MDSASISGRIEVNLRRFLPMGASEDTGIQIINFANEWGLTLIGLALILGIFKRFASMVEK